MKAALLIVVSLAALAYAGPATVGKNTNNQIGGSEKTIKQQQQQYMTTGKQTEAVELLKQWCFSSQMSQPELTVSFKKLVSVIKSQQSELDHQSTEAAVMSERICQGALVQKSSSSERAQTLGAQGVDAQAHQLIKDVYMDALIACESRKCKQQLVKIIDSGAEEQKIDAIRAAYYMTRIAVTETDSVAKDSEAEIKQLVESLIKSTQNFDSIASEAVERQKLFATTSLIAKAFKPESELNKSSTLKQTAEQVAKLIVERYIKPVSQQEVEQYQQQQQQQQQQTSGQSALVAKKIARRSAALKALANIPGWIIKQISEVEQILLEIAQNKQELSIARQSAIECLEENEQVISALKQITFNTQEPIEVRVAAVRALMTSVYAGQQQTDATKKQMASDIVEQVLKHCEDSASQHNDEQFVLYAISYLDNLRSSQQVENQAIRECIAANKQHYMQIQLLNKKFAKELSEVRKSSRNYKFEQEFNQIESGLIIEGDIVYSSKQHRQSGYEVLPKLMRVNMSMPVMGETVNVLELTVRQNGMDEELMGAFKLAQGASFVGSETVSKVVDSFKKSATEHKNNNNKQQTAEADMSIKVDGCNVAYICMDDFKYAASKHSQHERIARSSASIIDEIIEQLKQQPINFNRGFNFNINERFAKILDIDANIIAGLRFESRASGSSSDDFEIQTRIEPRFAFEAIVGPAKVSQKKLMQRVSTKTALGLRLRFKQNQLLDVQVDLPMNTMELFTVESQLVEKSSTVAHSYTYLPESIYGQEDIYTLTSDRFYQPIEQQQQQQFNTNYKRSIFQRDASISKQLAKLVSGKRAYAHSIETPEEFVRATGLRTALRVIASPKDMSFLVQVVCEKYEPSMQGFRFQVQKVERTRDQQQYIVSVSTPGSRTDRTVQLRLAVQSTEQRDVVKCEVQWPQMTVSALYELVHDQRAYAIKTQLECNTASRQLWRHAFECGVQRNSGSASGSARIASSTYKPYLSIDSTSLKRPVQLEGVVSYQQTPKTVISYELKCSTTGDFVQGKLIVDQRQAASTYNKRVSTSRHMRSPMELIFNEQDIVMTAEMTSQIAQHAIKAHKMFDWSATKKALVTDTFVYYKNLRSSVNDWQIVSSLKLNKEQQVFQVERKCPQQERKEFRVVVDSQLKPQSSQHQLMAELRYNGKSQSIVAYKHKVELAQLSMAQNKAELAYTVELIASEHQLNEKFTGRTLVNWARKQKTLKSELVSRNKSAKIDVDYKSLDQHTIELVFQGEQIAHRCSLVSDERQVLLVSRTEQRGLVLAKLNLKANKQTPFDCELELDVPVKNVQLVADLELDSGKTSSVAIKTPRFSSKAEFSFDRFASTSNNKYNKQSSWSMNPFGSISNLKFKSDLKDSMKAENFWIDSQINKMDKSFLRFDSPIYRTDLEFDARDSSAKFGAFARSKRSISGQMYSSDESLLNEPFSFDSDSTTTTGNKLNLGNKVWMMRSAASAAPKELRRALFEYADSRQQHKHGLNWSPRDQRVNFNLNRVPTMKSSFSPMRLTGDVATNWANTKQWNSINKPSSLKMSSDMVDFDFVASPFDGEQSFVRMNALSRHPRSAFKKHDAEWTYNKKHGHKAWMKYVDAGNKRHSFNLDADQSPKKWTKMSFDSDKHGKVDYEHQWRKHLVKRSALDSTMAPSSWMYTTTDNNNMQDDMVYANKLSLRGESPVWGSHNSQMQWIEPESLVLSASRFRRDLNSGRRFSTRDYLKHVGAHVESTSRLPSADEQLYKVDFDFKPESYNTRLSMALPEQMLHESSYEYEPTERAYKLHSKYWNTITKQPSYEFLASSVRPLVENLATANQEPVFIDEDHPMLEQPISHRLATQFLRQPLKLDYSDKFGRVARLDYDQFAGAASNYNGLRQKRAALFYKDDSMDFDHQSTFDFYPETLIGQVKSGYKTKQSSTAGDFSIKSQTKYGPIVVHANADDQNANLVIESPIVRVKLTTEEAKVSRNNVQLINVQVDNKQQGVKLAKVLRQNLPLLAECPVIEEFVSKFDQTKFEHETELLISFVDSIFKVKSMTQMDKRAVLIVNGEFNSQQDKAYFKIDGEHTKGQLIVDLNKQTAHLVFSVEGKRSMHHETRVARTSDKFFSVDSMTTYKQQPLFKLSARVSASILNEGEHLFASRRLSSSSSTFGGLSGNEQHVSTFDAIFYHPKQYQLSGKYDCLKKEAQVVVRDVEKRETSELRVVYDEQAENVYVQARSASPRGIVKQMNKTINVTPLVKAY